MTLINAAVLFMYTYVPIIDVYTTQHIFDYRLHEHKEVVEELVATAAKELKIENQLEVRHLLYTHMHPGA